VVEGEYLLRIDVHAHYFPVEYLDRWTNTVESGHDIHRKAKLASADLRDLENHFRNMDLAKVDMQVLSLSSQLPYLPTKTKR